MSTGLEQRAAAILRACVRAAPAVVISLAAVLLLWSRLLPLTHGLWNDEAYSALVYIRPGPSAIFGQYIANDHMLFELLAWATTNLTGDFGEPALRFWSVVPGLAAGVVTTWWLWRRLGPWVAAIFAVLAAAAPLYFELSIQARGYGLAYLAAAGMLITADSVMWRQSRRVLLLFAVSATVGIWTLPVFVVGFLSLAGLLAARESLRRDVAWVVIGVGAVSLLFYLPVLSDVVQASGGHFGTQLPWDGVVSGPLKDLITPSVDQLLPSASLTAAELIGGGLIALGVIALWRRPERRLALALISPTLITYLVLEVGRFYEASRFVSFLGLSLLVLCAVALVEAGRVLARSRPGRLVAVVCAIALSLVVLSKAEHSFRGPVQTPIENFKEAAQLVDASRIAKVVSNSTKAVGFNYYFGTGRVQFETPTELQSLFCSKAEPFVYIEHGLSPLADTKCLRQRGSIPILVPQSRSSIAVWFVTTTPPGR